MLVDVRHEATHGALPSLALLQRCRAEALAWLRTHYWTCPDELAAPRAPDPVSQLRQGALPAAAPLPATRINQDALHELVALRSKRPPPAAVAPAADDPALLLPPVPRWGSSQAPAWHKRAKLAHIAASVDF